MTPFTKNSHVDEDSIYEIFSVPFGSATEFIKTVLANGDRFIPLGGKLTSGQAETCDNTIEYLKSYDDNLMKVYQRRENTLVLQNIKFAGNPEHPEYKGCSDLLEHIADGIDYIKSKLGKLFPLLVKAILKMYDNKMADSSGSSPNTYVWLPVWNANAETATMMVIMNKFIIVVT